MWISASQPMYLWSGSDTPRSPKTQALKLSQGWRLDPIPSATFNFVSLSKMREGKTAEGFWHNDWGDFPHLRHRGFRVTDCWESLLQWKLNLYRQLCWLVCIFVRYCLAAECGVDGLARVLYPCIAIADVSLLSQDPCCILVRVSSSTPPLWHSAAKHHGWLSLSECFCRNFWTHVLSCLYIHDETVFLWASFEPHKR